MIDTYLEYHRGDGHPIIAKLTRDDEWVLTGSTIELTMIFDDDVVHTVEGTILDEDEKTVQFIPITAAVATVRKGKYDIQVDDGFYKSTHITGVISIIEDVTP